MTGETNSRRKFLLGLSLLIIIYFTISGWLARNGCANYQGLRSRMRDLLHIGRKEKLIKKILLNQGKIKIFIIHL